MTGIVGDTVSWGLLAGIITPWLTAVVQQPRWSAPARQAVAVVVSVVVGVLVLLSTGDLGRGKTALATIATVVVAAHLAYDRIWRKGIAPAIEAATTPGAGVVYGGGGAHSAEPAATADDTDTG